MTKKERYDKVINWFEANHPIAETELEYKDPYSLLVAVILSAQCTDKRVNIVTPPLIEAYPTPDAMAQATPEEIFEYIKSISYPNNKSKHLVGMAKKLVEEFDGIMPNNVDDLQKLPGVGRKTANVITSVIDSQPNMAVDTHVFRVSHRLGLSDGKDPAAVEKDLMRVIPREKWGEAHHWLIWHGRKICKARKPSCMECMLINLCPDEDKNFINK